MDPYEGFTTGEVPVPVLSGILSTGLLAVTNASLAKECSCDW